MIFRTIPFVVSALVLLVASDSGIQAAPVKSGKATRYADKYVGRKTANGERYDQRAMTAASAQFPIGSTVKVTNKINGKTVTVRINDKESVGGGKLVDLSKAAAKKLGMTGTAPVTATLVLRPYLCMAKSKPAKHSHRIAFKHDKRHLALARSHWLR